MRGEEDRMKEVKEIMKRRSFFPPTAGKRKQLFLWKTKERMKAELKNAGLLENQRCPDGGNIWLFLTGAFG